ncbi:MAG: phosphodiester glycosidase family protein [Thermodesulfobacteriota bacterium]|nr:phosphodiester glycosidase family protein [Thermodesulfobacteriota bacterium]MEA1991283.1 phosphodiester glycosidase family protein [Thermodesulfobacteriota bacterium]
MSKQIRLTEWFIAIITVFLIVGAAKQIRADDTWEKVVNGVEYLHRTDSTVPWNIHVLKIDLTDPDISLRPILANDSWGPYMETTSSMAARTRALAAINADYSGFTGPPEGTTIIEGIQYDIEQYPRSTLAFSANKGLADIGIWTSTESLPGWVYNAISGGPTILRDGIYDWDPYNENFLEDFKLAKRARQPRTGAALSVDGNTLILAVVDGRQPAISVGMTAEEFTNLLIEMGGYTGMDFDGGGSTTMVINNTIVNSPSDGAERSVANAFAVFSRDQSLAHIDGNDEVYWLQNGKAYPILETIQGVQIIQNMSELPRWGISDIIEYAAAELEIRPPGTLPVEDSFEQGPDFISINPESNGLLIKLPDDTKVYLIEDGKRRWITTEAVFNNLSYDWADVIVITQAILDLIPEGDPLYFATRTMNFEDGVDRQPIRSIIPGLQFTTTDGYDWIYGDWRAGYNGPYPNGSYFSNGNFFAWLGENQGTGRIDFTGATATYLSFLTSTYSGLTMDAYDINNNWLTTSGWATNNLNTGQMTKLTVAAPNMAYVLVHDTGNYWLIDDLEIGDLLAVAKAYLPASFIAEYENLDTLDQDQSKWKAFFNEIYQTIKIILGWGGSELSIQIYNPDGILYNEYQSDMPPIIIDIPDAEPGQWKFKITAIDVPENNYPFALVVGIPDAVCPNIPPIADAGLYDLVEVGSGCVAAVPLDGSGSSDPDGDPLTYTWAWDDGSSIGSASGVNPTINLPIGTFTITLVVNDGTEDSEPDEVDITVEDTIPPATQIISPVSNGALQDGVILTADASDVCDVTEVYFYVREADGGSGSPIEYENLPGAYNGTSWECNFDTNTSQTPDGYYVILTKAVDTNGNEGWSTPVPVSIRNWAVIELLPNTASNKAGRTMPVKFALRIAAAVDPLQPFVYNEELEIRIYDASAPDTILQTSQYGENASTDYRIDTAEELYITNFKTSKKPAQYVVEIWRISKNFLVGSFTFETVK